MLMKPLNGKARAKLLDAGIPKEQSLFFLLLTACNIPIEYHRYALPVVAAAVIARTVASDK